MDADQYQREVQRTMNGGQTRDMCLANYALGLCGEAGEAGELVKKHVFHGHVELDKQKLIKELGDVLWYVGALAREAGIDLSLIMELNVLKLRERYPQGFTTAASLARKDVHT